MGDQVPEVTDLALTNAVNTAESLFYTIGVPGQVVVDHEVGALQVEPLAGGVGGEQHQGPGVVRELFADGLAKMPRRAPMNGDNGVDACVFNALGQFARQAMKHLYAIAQQVFHHAATSPRRLFQRVFRVLGVHHAQVRRTFHLSGQVFSARIGCIKQQLCVGIEGSKVVN